MKFDRKQRNRLRSRFCATASAKIFSSRSGSQSPRKLSRGDFFDFLQQQGYLRVWIDNKVVRVDDPNPKTKRLGARVQVVQDRIAITGENRTRLVEAIETALRFGKGQVNVIPVEAGVSPATSKTATDSATTTVLPFSTGWHCAWCDLDIRPPTVGLFSFNNPLGACPDCRGFGRTIAIDLNKAIPDRSLTIKQGVVRVFRGVEFGESQKDLLRACAREEIDINVPFEELPKADQNFVIEGERRSGEYTDEDYEQIAGMECAAFFAGWKARPTKCTCECCSAATAHMSPVLNATAAAISPILSITKL